jgi:ketosteroid isomerase-like protein
VSENLDLVRSIYADWERGDWSSLDWADPDIELVAVGGPEPGTYAGAEAVGRAWRDFLTAWQGYRVAAQEYRELDAGRVLVSNLTAGRGRGSGFEVGQTETKGANVFQIRDGKVTRLVVYWDRERALADLGLAE